MRLLERPAGTHTTGMHQWGFHGPCRGWGTGPGVGPPCGAAPWVSRQSHSPRRRRPQRGERALRPPRPGVLHVLRVAALPRRVRECSPASLSRAGRSEERRHWALARRLGPTHCRPIAVHCIPFPTSVLVGLKRVIATFTKIRTTSRSTLPRGIGASSRPARPPTHRRFPSAPVGLDRRLATAP